MKATPFQVSLPSENAYIFKHIPNTAFHVKPLCIYLEGKIKGQPRLVFYAKSNA